MGPLSEESSSNALRSGNGTESSFSFVEIALESRTEVCPDFCAAKIVRMIEVVRKKTAIIHVSLVMAVAADLPDISPEFPEPPPVPSPPPSDL